MKQQAVSVEKNSTLLAWPVVNAILADGGNDVTGSAV
jgi:hypothetical protein